MADLKFAKPVVSSLFLLSAAILQLYFLRGLFAYPFEQFPMVLLIELMFAGLTVYGAARSANPRGWGSIAGSGAAIVAYAAYVGFTVINYDLLSQFYALSLGESEANLGLAAVVGKMFLVLLGVFAAVPVKPQPTQEEYADAFVDAMELQKVEWARASAKNAKKELEEMAAQLKEQEAALKRGRPEQDEQMQEDVSQPE